MRRGGFEPLFRNIKSEFNVHVNEGEYLADLLGLSVCVSDISETGLQESFNPPPPSPCPIMQKTSGHIRVHPKPQKAR